MTSKNYEYLFVRTKRQNYINDKPTLIKNIKKHREKYLKEIQGVLDTGFMKEHITRELNNLVNEIESGEI